MSAKRSSSRSPRKRRVKINDENQVFLFKAQTPENSPGSNPYQKPPSPETSQQEYERKVREAKALDNKYANSAFIKDRRAYRRHMLRRLKSEGVSTEDLISVSRKEKNLSIPTFSAVIKNKETQPIPQKQPSFLMRVFTPLSAKKKAGNKTMKRKRY